MEVGVDGWNEEGRTLYRIIRGCLKAIDRKHWEEDWQRYWGAHPENVLVKKKRKLHDWESTDDTAEDPNKSVRMDTDDVMFEAV